MLRNGTSVEVEMGRRAARLLESILDGKWHAELPEEVGAGTVNACIERGFIRTKRVDVKRDGDFESFRMAICITVLGKAALKK